MLIFGKNKVMSRAYTHFLLHPGDFQVRYLCVHNRLHRKISERVWRKTKYQTRTYQYQYDCIMCTSLVEYYDTEYPFLQA